MLTQLLNRVSINAVAGDAAQPYGFCRKPRRVSEKNLGLDACGFRVQSFALAVNQGL